MDIRSQESVKFGVFSKILTLYLTNMEYNQVFPKNQQQTSRTENGERKSAESSKSFSFYRRILVWKDLKYFIVNVIMNLMKIHVIFVVLFLSSLAIENNDENHEDDSSSDESDDGKLQNL